MGDLSLARQDMKGHYRLLAKIRMTTVCVYEIGRKNQSQYATTLSRILPFFGCDTKKRTSDMNAYLELFEGRTLLVLIRNRDRIRSDAGTMRSHHVVVPRASSPESDSHM